ncbi:MAG: hypothetical protein KAI17_27405 [Thiotrichaceae bacterium]|nr:hypothetical protein [Thiotrichaceae bacterium]
MGWNQVQYTSREEVVNALSDLVTVVSRTKPGDAKILGTAFPVFASDNNTLMLTASHVIEEAYKSSAQSKKNNIRNLNHIPGPDNKLYKFIGQWVEQSNDLWCLLAVGEKLVQCFVTGVCIRPPLDMALLVLDTSHLKKLTSVFAINSNILNVGEEIVVTAWETKGEPC